MGAGPSGPVFIRDPDHLKLQLQELHATEANGLSDLVEGELQKVEWCDLMTWQFPLWWFGLPAAWEGWVDRVFAMGRTYGGGHIYETGVFRGKRALLSLTTGGPGPGDRTPPRPYRIHGHRGVAAHTPTPPRVARVAEELGGPEHRRPPVIARTTGVALVE